MNYGLSHPYVMVSTILILKGSGVGRPSSLSGAPVGGCRLLMFCLILSFLRGGCGRSHDSVRLRASARDLLVLCSLWGAPELGVGDAAGALITGLLAAAGGGLAVSEAKAEAAGAMYVIRRRGIVYARVWGLHASTWMEQGAVWQQQMQVQSHG